VKRRTVTVLAVLLCVLGIQVGATAAATGQHVYHGEFDLKGKRGTLHISLRFEYGGFRSWQVGQPRGVAADGTGAYDGLTGRGQRFQAGGHKDAWYARIAGFVQRPGETKQWVVIDLKGRPDGTFVLTPKKTGALKRDTGAQTSGWLG
jgi:hypothetical protein